MRRTSEANDQNISWNLRRIRIDLTVGIRFACKQVYHLFFWVTHKMYDFLFNTCCSWANASSSSRLDDDDSQFSLFVSVTHSKWYQMNVNFHLTQNFISCFKFQFRFVQKTFPTLEIWTFIQLFYKVMVWNVIFYQKID